MPTCIFINEFWVALADQRVTKGCAQQHNAALIISGVFTRVSIEGMRYPKDSASTKLENAFELT